MGQQVMETLPIGAVLSKRGKVTAIRQGQAMRILKRGDAIYADDVVNTVRGATLQLRMSDRNIIMLRGGSSFRVTQYQPEITTNEVKRFDYAGGELRPSRKGLSFE